MTDAARSLARVRDWAVALREEKASDPVAVAALTQIIEKIDEEIRDAEPKADEPKAFDIESAILEIFLPSSQMSVWAA